MLLRLQSTPPRYKPKHLWAKSGKAKLLPQRITQTLLRFLQHISSEITAFLLYFIHKTEKGFIYITKKRKGAMKIAITINEILIPKKLFSAKLDKELEFDSALPDYCPDIARLIKVDCTPFTEGCNMENGKVVVNGKAVYDVLYETDYKNRLRCCTFAQDFSISVPIPAGAENPYAFCNCGCERISCKLLSPRRLLLKASLWADMTMEGDLPAKALNVDEGRDIFFKKKTIGFEGRTALYNESFHFSDSLGLAQSEKSIGEIVCGTVTLQPPQAV